jgi:hypothetical protein
MRHAPRLTALLVVTALLLAGGATPAAAAPAGEQAAVGDSPPLRLDEPANTTVEVRLYTNASARVTVRTTYLLESEEERATFRDYAAAYRSGGTDAGPRAAPFVAAAERAGAVAGREMRVTNVTRTSAVDGATGSVAVGLRWTAFLDRAENDTLRIDEALRLGGDRTWLGSLAADQTLVVRTPPGYSIVDSGGPSFEFRDNAIRFEGPREFDGRLTVTYRQTGPPEPRGPEVPWGVLGGAAVAALAVAAAYTRLRGDDDDGPAPVDDAPAEGDGGEPAAADPDPEPAPDPELLSDDERVERLLEANGGRMKQAAIVDETGWSDAKVSQLLSSMADEGRVEKLRLGRENLISLPDDDES